MKVGLIIGKFMPFHKGHKLLIDFATNYIQVAGLSELHVLVCSQPGEPIDGLLRVAAVQNSIDPQDEQVYVHWLDETMPQVPEDHPDFWNIWKTAIGNNVPVLQYHGTEVVVFSSETYGEKLAQVLGGTHIPVNIDRDIYRVSGTKVRQDIVGNWDDLAPEMATILRRTVTVIGPESTGKSTLVNQLRKQVPSMFTTVPEYARGYIESKRLEKDQFDNQFFKTITMGQIAMFDAVKATPDTPFVVRDTDLLTTLGYYRLYNPGRLFPLPDIVISINRADHYVVLPDTIPFTPDPLRYGGDKRETNVKYWTDLLDEYKLPYTILDSKRNYVNEVVALSESLMDK